MSEKLKPCPLCGGERILHDHADADEDRPDMVHCRDCDFVTTVDAWQALPRQSEDAREIVREMEEAITSGMYGGTVRGVEIGAPLIADWQSRLKSIAELQRDEWPSCQVCSCEIEGQSATCDECLTGEPEWETVPGLVRVYIHDGDGNPLGPRDVTVKVHANNPGGDTFGEAWHRNVKVHGAPPQEQRETVRAEVWVAEYTPPYRNTATYTPAVYAAKPDIGGPWIRVPVHGAPTQDTSSPYSEVAQRVIKDMFREVELCEPDRTLVQPARVKRWATELANSSPTTTPTCAGCEHVQCSIDPNIHGPCELFVKAEATKPPPQDDRECSNCGEEAEDLICNECVDQHIYYAVDVACGILVDAGIDPDEVGLEDRYRVADLGEAYERLKAVNSAPPEVCMLVPHHISAVGGIKLFANPTVVEGNEPGDVLFTGVPVLGTRPLSGEIWIGIPKNESWCGSLFSSRAAFDEYNDLTNGERWFVKARVKGAGWSGKALDEEAEASQPTKPDYGFGFECKCTASGKQKIFSSAGWGSEVEQTFDGLPCPGTCLTLAGEIEEARAGEKIVSDAYLRIREKLGAWKTRPGGSDRFEVTEAALDALLADREFLRKDNEECRTFWPELDELLRSHWEGGSNPHKIAVAIRVLKERAKEIETLRKRLREEAVSLGFVKCSRCGAQRTSPEEAVASITYSCLGGCAPKKTTCGTCIHWIGSRCEKHGVTCGSDWGTHCKEWGLIEKPPGVHVNYVQVVDVCPECSGSLGWSGGDWMCEKCGHRGTYEDLHPLGKFTYTEVATGQEGATTTDGPSYSSIAQDMQREAAAWAAPNDQSHWLHVPDKHVPPGPKPCPCGSGKEQPCQTEDDLPAVTCMSVGELIDEMASIYPDAEDQPAFLELARRIRRDRPDLYPPGGGDEVARKAYKYWKGQADELETKVEQLNKYGAGQHAKVDELKADLGRWKKLSNRQWAKRCKAEQQARRERLEFREKEEQLRADVQQYKDLGAKVDTVIVDGLTTDVEYWKGQYAEVNEKHFTLRQRARTAAQAIIEELGSMGPEGLDETAHRACVALVARRERVEELQKQLERMEKAHREVLAELDISQQEVADLQGLLAQQNKERESHIEEIARLKSDGMMVLGRCPQCEERIYWDGPRWYCEAGECGASGTRPKDDEPSEVKPDPRTTPQRLADDMELQVIEGAPPEPEPEPEPEAPAPVIDSAWHKAEWAAGTPGEPDKDGAWHCHECDGYYYPVDDMKSASGEWRWRDDAWEHKCRAAEVEKSKDDVNADQPVLHGEKSIPCSKCGATSSEAPLRSIGRVWSCADEDACLARWTKKDGG